MQRSARTAAFAVTCIVALLSTLWTHGPATAASGMRITFSARSISARDAVMRVGAFFGLSVVVSGSLDQRVSVSLRGLTLDEALNALLAPLGVAYQRNGNVLSVAGRAARTSATRTGFAPTTLSISQMPVDRAAATLRQLFPSAHILVDHAARVLIVQALPDDLNGMRAVLQGIDVRSPEKPVSAAVALQHVSAQLVVAKLRPLFPGARLSAGPDKTVVIEANDQDQNQIKTLISSLDVPPPAGPPANTDAVRVTQVSASAVASLVHQQIRDVEATAVGSTVVLKGPPDAVASAKSLVVLVDVPQAQTRYTNVYRLRFADAKDAESIIARSFPDAQVTLNEELNALSVFATGAEHARIADALNQLDDAPAERSGSQSGATTDTPGGAVTIDVVPLRSAIPAQAANTPSTTPSDIANIVLQNLSSVAPDLKVTPAYSPAELVVSGSPYAVKLAKDLIARLDVPQQLVVMDTQIVELNETTAKNLGLSFAPNSVLTTTYSETSPQPIANGNTPPLLGLQPLSRTPLSLQFQLGLAISQGKGRILADPRITTISGKTASLRAGDNITVLTQSGGGTGVAVTTQLQTFQTGVSLDITPELNADNYITINLHPVVNSVTSYNAQNIPQIATRDTQTTIGLREGQTLVIGGLIQDNTSRTTTKIPLLGDLPLIGPLFRNEQINNSRDELIITITPHVVDPLKAGAMIPFPTSVPIPTGSALYAPGTAAPPAIVRQGESQRPRAIVAYGSQGRAGVAGVNQGPRLPPMPTPNAGPTPAPSPLTGTGGNVSLPQSPLGPLPFGLPATGGASSPTPGAAPSAFGNTNVFTYGQAPSNNYAAATDPVQVFYVNFAPTVLQNGTTFNVSAITTTNVTKVTVGFGSTTAPLTSVGQGKWQGSYPFSTAGLPASQSQVQLTLTAQRNDGTASSVNIPVSVSGS
ncbi:MAG: secretin N-terminal domain-containing protein [Vulcanimicrobiaceae bacterium]